MAARTACCARPLRSTRGTHFLSPHIIFGKKTFQTSQDALLVERSANAAAATPSPDKKKAGRTGKMQTVETTADDTEGTSKAADSKRTGPSESADGASHYLGDAYLSPTFSGF
ncbi:hypothetical protein VPH35_015495 [Triticum aestivum]